jgi:hypothetical protein
MKGLFRIFDLSKNEQRVVLIVMFVLIAMALVMYERRIRHAPVQPTSTREAKSSPSPVEAQGDQQLQSSLNP